ESDLRRVVGVAGYLGLDCHVRVQLLKAFYERRCERGGVLRCQRQRHLPRRESRRRRSRTRRVCAGAPPRWRARCCHQRDSASCHCQPGGHSGRTLACQFHLSPPVLSLPITVLPVPTRPSSVSNTTQQRSGYCPVRNVVMFVSLMSARTILRETGLSPLRNP